VSRPEAIVKKVDGQTMEPVERLTLEVREEHLGAVTEALGNRSPVSPGRPTGPTATFAAPL